MFEAHEYLVNYLKCYKNCLKLPPLDGGSIHFHIHTTVVLKKVIAAQFLQKLFFFL